MGKHPVDMRPARICKEKSTMDMVNANTVNVPAPIFFLP